MTLDDLILQTSYLDLDNEFYDLSDPIPLNEPFLISFNSEAAKLIGLNIDISDDPFVVHFCTAGHGLASLLGLALEPR